MVGYKCNKCGDKISEKKYKYLKQKDDLRCMECQSGFYVPYFQDEDSKYNTDLDFTDKVNNIVKKGNNLPGATVPNRFIGAGLLGVVGASALSSLFNWSGVGVIGLVLGGVAGWILAPYFVPIVRKIFRKIVKAISRVKKTDDDE